MIIVSIIINNRCIFRTHPSPQCKKKKDSLNNLELRTGKQKPLFLSVCGALWPVSSLLPSGMFSILLFAPDLPATALDGWAHGLFTPRQDLFTSRDPINWQVGLLILNCWSSIYGLNLILVDRALYDTRMTGRRADGLLWVGFLSLDWPGTGGAHGRQSTH